MIPLTVQLKNFLSYGEQPVTVDFAPHHLMCLSGKNGHGKSALLDAITWAVWGQARKVGGVPRDDMRLMRLGQQHMQVVFDFICNQQRYQVKREMTMSHDKAYSTLEFGMFDAAADKMVPLTDKTIRLTQQKIETMIGFTYESFTNSVFLRQGQSNEFSKKTARERKEVLSTILGLDRYERVRSVLLDRARADSERKVATEQLLVRLDEQCSRESQTRAHMHSCQQQLLELAQAEQALHARQQELNAERETLRVRAEQLALAQSNVRMLIEQIRSYELSKQLSGAQQRSDFEVKRADIQAQQRSLAQNQRALQDRLHVLKREQAQVQAAIATLAARAQVHDQTEVQFQVAQRLWEKRKALYHKMVGYAHWVNRELADARMRKEQVHDRQQPQCPLCEQPLRDERQQFLCAKLGHMQGFYEHRLRRVSRFLRTNKTQLEGEQQALSSMSQQLQQLVQAQTQQKSLQERLGVVELECSQLASQEGEACQQAAQLAVQAGQIKQAQQEHEQLVQRVLIDDAQYHELKNKLQQAQEQVQLLQAHDVAQLQAQLSQHEREFVERERMVREQKHTLMQQQGGLEREMRYIEQMSTERTACQALLRELDAQIAEQRAIADAFGKDGIQALLIESVIPELEAEANALLARLSDQNTQVFIESLRDLKKGGARETLDINIADNLGIRPYELFSGGEAFRIDFALRVAISKLLARRAGATLQTLIIDEGFGSQDEDGLALIMDVLYRVQADFAKIIVVSHLSALKEQFPVHLVVEKGAQGSLVRVVEQG